MKNKDEKKVEKVVSSITVNADGKDLEISTCEDEEIPVTNIKEYTEDESLAKEISKCKDCKKIGVGIETLTNAVEIHNIYRVIFVPCIKHAGSMEKAFGVEVHEELSESKK